VVPVLDVCKPYPELQAVIVTVPFDAIVHVEAPVVHVSQVIVPLVAVFKAYPD